ncbi:MAG: DUF4393 domain-containing protein [Armatimonadota bacterium]
MSVTDPEKIAEITKGILEAVPVYEDAIQPLARQVGTALETLGKTINVALAPLRGMIWGYDQIEEFLKRTLEDKLKDVPIDRITTPSPSIAGPALESLRFCANEEVLRDMFANLLATSMDSKSAINAHPSFVEIIRQLTPIEAKIITLLYDERSIPLITIRTEHIAERGGQDIFRNFSLIGDQLHFPNHQIISSYLDNICRLGLSNIPYDYTLTKPNIYDPLEDHYFAKSQLEIANSIDQCKGIYVKKTLQITDFGEQFYNTCMKPIGK